MDFSDVETLVAAWQTISELRVAAGDTPLKGKSIYATDRGLLVVCSVDNMTFEYPFDLSTQDYNLLILKR